MRRHRLLGTGASSILIRRIPSPWGRFDGTGTPAFAQQVGMASLTDNAVGDFTLTFTRTMANANYGIGSIGFLTGAATSSSRMDISDAAGPSTAAVRIRAVQYRSAGAYVDTTINTVIVCGDQ